MFQDKCIICFMTHADNWDGHSSDNCKKKIGTNKEDPAFLSFRSYSMDLPKGWCYICLVHQVLFFFSSFLSWHFIEQKEMMHPYTIIPCDCIWKNIIQRALYIATFLKLPCLFLPEDRWYPPGWLSQGPGTYKGFAFHNGLRGFLWIVNEHCRIFNDPVNNLYAH